MGAAATLAKTHAASAHRLQGNYREAIDRYRSIVDSAGRVLPQAQVEIGDIFFENLNQPDSALDVFKDLVAQRPDTEPATMAQTKIAAILIERGQYQEARNLLRPLKAAYEKRGQLVAGIQLLVGRTYEAEGAWDRALNEYSWLADNFPDLPQTQDVYLHVIANMVREGNMGIANQWQRDAVDHYGTVIERNPQTELAAIAQRNLARSWLIIEEWQNGAEAYQVLINTYPGAPSIVESYIELSAVYSDRMDDPQRGIDVLQALLKQFPSLSFREDIEARIAALRARLS
jgi:tetratricopeptide (TPR) repeat protein